MSNRKVEVVEYSPNWATDFEQEKSKLANALGEIAINIEHIGSTSIVGLCAKPIIDILIEVSCLKAVDEKNSQLEQLVYRVRGENSITGRRYFDKGGDNRTHHVHVFLTGDENLIRHRAFKHYLVAHPNALKAYADIKKQAASNCNHDISAYMAMKNDFIQTHEKLAVKWFNSL